MAVRLYRSIHTLIALTIVINCSSCKNDNLEMIDDTSNYPPEISAILVNKCSTSGCHNEQNKAAVGGISFETWEEMFEGGRGGAVVIPFRPDFSTTMYFINTDTSKGVALIPTMPYNSSPLSEEECSIIREWIQNGAPDKNGFVKFSDDPSRQKLYVANKGADVITVFDVQSNLDMRYVDAGVTGSIESPQMIKVSPDNNYWYAIFFVSSVLQKFRTSDNAHVADVSIGTGNWSSLSITPDSKKAYVVEAGGQIVVVNLENMTTIETWTGFTDAKSSSLNQNGDTLYVTSRTGNFIYKIPAQNNLAFEKISLNPIELPSSVPSLDPHGIIFNGDFSKYYVSCQRSNEVRVMQTSNDSLLNVIPTSEFPVEMSMSSTKPYLFVSCMTAVNPGITLLGRVDVIDINTNAVFSSVMTGHNPYGIAVSDKYNKVFVANRNSSHGGPVPHHTTILGKNGYITAIDLNTLNLIPGFKTEVSVDPYSIAISR